MEKSSNASGEEEYERGWLLFVNLQFRECLPFFRSAAKLGCTKAMVRLLELNDMEELEPSIHHSFAESCVAQMPIFLADYEKTFTLKSLYNLSCLQKFCYEDKTNLKKAFASFSDCAKFAIKDKDKAMETLCKFQIAHCFQFGIGVHQDLKTASAEYVIVSESGHCLAIYQLSSILGNGFDLGREHESAFELCKKAASLGVSRAQFTLGLWLENGTNCEKDPKKAFEYYESAAKSGHSTALLHVGQAYHDGIIIPQDKKKAFSYYEQSSKLGNLEALNALANCYFDGIGVEQNWEEAVHLFKKSSERGSAVAFFNLGKCAEVGHGIPKNLKLAISYYQKAVDLGLLRAKNVLYRAKTKLALVDE